MTWSEMIAFALGFGTATVLIVGVGFFWLKRRWKSMLFGLGTKLFSKGVSHVQSRRAGRQSSALDPDFREIGRQ